VYSRELDELKKKYGDVDSKVTEMRLKRMEMEETYKNLEKMKEEQVRYYDQLLEDKTAKVSTAIQAVILFICLTWSNALILIPAMYFITNFLD
jgi:sugar diacid utilization regulator